MVALVASKKARRGLGQSAVACLEQYKVGGWDAYHVEAQQAS